MATDSEEIYKRSKNDESSSQLTKQFLLKEVNGKKHRSSAFFKGGFPHLSTSSLETLS
ncbi:hypothetical protein HanPSC8_Chr13g0591581 [Helianthus annuus]|nr:hypothetical protein HanPSC8_Chr13g0591581 [Helianthus annuus]